MKIKTLTKKLSLRKNTIANLVDREMKEVQGGIILSVKICTFDTNSCISTNVCC